MTLGIYKLSLLPKRYLISLFTLIPLCFYNVFFSVSTSWIAYPSEQSSFSYCVACCVMHSLVSKQVLQLEIAKSNHSCSTISCRVGVASAYWFIQVGD